MHEMGIANSILDGVTTELRRRPGSALLGFLWPAKMPRALKPSGDGHATPSALPVAKMTGGPRRR